MEPTLRINFCDVVYDGELEKQIMHIRFKAAN